MTKYYNVWYTYANRWTNGIVKGQAQDPNNPIPLTLEEATVLADKLNLG